MQKEKESINKQMSERFQTLVQSLGVKNRPYCSLLAASAKTCVVLGWVIYFKKQQGKELPGSCLLPCSTKDVPPMPGSIHCVAVSRGYDTCFSGKACDGLCRLLKSTGLGWNAIRVSIDRVDLCQTHCKQVPDRKCYRKWPHVASRQFLPSGKYGLCFQGSNWLEVLRAENTVTRAFLEKIPLYIIFI